MKRHLLALMLAAAMGLAPASPNVAWSQDAGPPVTAARKPAPTTVHRVDRASAAATFDGYASREAGARDLESFTGGRHDDVLIVGCSCVVIVILILIII